MHVTYRDPEIPDVLIGIKDQADLEEKLREHVIDKFDQVDKVLITTSPGKPYPEETGNRSERRRFAREQRRKR